MATTKAAHCLRTTVTLGLLVVAGCNPVPPTPATAQAHGVRVAELELLHTVYFDIDDAELRPAEVAGLRQFAAQLDERVSLDSIVIGHADVRPSDVHNDALSARRAATVADLLVAAGVSPAQITRDALGRRVPVVDDDQETASRLSRRVEIVARGIALVEPNCPDWSRPSAAHPANLATSNLGCATSINLVRMVADPRDLARGAALGASDPTRTANAVSRFRAGDVEPLRMEASSR